MSFLDDARAWTVGRQPSWRLPVVAWGAWMAWGTAVERQGFNLFAALTFQVHEFGHLAFSAFGTFLTVAGGSLMQLLVPGGAIALMRRAPDFVGMAFAGTWLAQSVLDLSFYIGDSRALQRDYVSLGMDGGDGPDDGTTGHDWQYLLQHTHLIQHDTQIAAVVRVVGQALLWASVLWAAWLCWRMWRGDDAPAPAPASRPTGGGRIR